MSGSIKIKSAREIELMRRAGAVTAGARDIARQMVVPGTKTRDIDRAVHDYIVKAGAKPSFLGYNGFPASACISVNDEVIHGIPGSRVIHEGDIVSVDVGAFLGGYHGDCAGSYIAGRGTSEAEQLVEVTRQSFFEGLKQAVAGNRLSDIARAVQSYCEERGYSIVRDYVGHGVGSELHEKPELPNFVEGIKDNVRLIPGMTLALEPMVNAGGVQIRVLRNGWTVVTRDGSLSAHYENTILITNGEPEILTASEVL